MAICDPMAMYESVVRRARENPVFASEEEIIALIKSLVSKGILEDKVGTVSDREIECLLRFGDIKSRDERVLSFASGKLNKNMAEMRLKLYDEIYYPK